MYEAFGLCRWPVEMFCYRLYCFLIWKELEGSVDALGLCLLSLRPPVEVEVKARFFWLLPELSVPLLAEWWPVEECFRLAFETLSDNFLFD